MSTQTDNERIMSRWLPRLHDSSPDVQEEAAQKLSQLAMGEPERQAGILLPLLFDLARKTKSWVIACNGIMNPTEEIPKTDDRWFDEFVDLYIDLAKKNAYVTSEDAYRYVARNKFSGNT